MSRAFVREQDGADAFDERPDKQISGHRNLVTAEGLAAIEAEVQRLTRAYAEAQAAGERGALNAAARDLRYWTARRTSAEVVPAPPETRDVRFGARVTLRSVPQANGEPHGVRTRTYRIVGEDEADPAHGTLSYVSPLARALMGLGVGDTVRVGQADQEIMAIA